MKSTWRNRLAKLQKAMERDSPAGARQVGFVVVNQGELPVDALERYFASNPGMEPGSFYFFYFITDHGR